MTPAAHRTVAPSQLSVTGHWGQMLAKTAEHWMLHVSDDLLLGGFRHKPGVQAWIGEHVGKFLLGAIPTSRLLNNDALVDKVRRLCDGLIAAQEPDGYLGTYLPADRWPDNRPKADFNAWDPWVHKYVILALLADHAATGRQASLDAAGRAADALLAHYGPGLKNINRSDCHGGLASGSVLEPLMLLYQRTGHRRYLDFAEYLIAAWQEPDGPGIVTHLRAGHSVNRIGNAKAYEMMSCFVGLAEYCRATGNAEFLPLLLRARDSIADTQRLPTGGMTRHEYFRPPGMLEEDAPAETCVTFTWIQLNLRLFELAGDARALDLAEEAAWNQLLPALSPSGNTWSYFLPLIGPKTFAAIWVQGVNQANDGGAPITCCHTNGQRGLALLPQYAHTITADGVIAVNFYGAGTARVDLPDGTVTIEQQTDFPASGRVTLRVRPTAGQSVPLLLRRPAWAGRMAVDGHEAPAGPRVPLTVSEPRTIEIDLDMSPRLLLCGLGARGKCALALGPLVLALENPPDGLALDQIALDLDASDWRAGLTPCTDAGWPALNVPFVATPATAVVDASTSLPAHRGRLRLRPVLCAGLAGNRSLAEPLAHNQIPQTTNTVRQDFLPEYRVLLPYFWRPN